MAVAALVISIVSTLGGLAGLAGLVGLVFARKSAGAALASATAASQSVTVAQAQAAAAEGQLEIERARWHHESTPDLMGRVIPVAGSDPPARELTIWSASSTPLRWLTVKIPADAPIAKPGGKGIRHELTWPPAGRRQLITSDNPARWPVVITRYDPGTIMLSVRCQAEHGERWDDVMVPVGMS